MMRVLSFFVFSPKQREINAGLERKWVECHFAFFWVRNHVLCHPDVWLEQLLLETKLANGEWWQRERGSISAQ